MCVCVWVFFHRTWMLMLIWKICTNLLSNVINKRNNQTKSIVLIKWRNECYLVCIWKMFGWCKNDSIYATLMMCWSIWLYTRVHFSHFDTLITTTAWHRKTTLNSQYAKNNIGWIIIFISIKSGFFSLLS